MLVRKLIGVMKDSRYRGVLLKYSVAAAVEHQAPLKLLGCRTVVDIGANEGQFALVAHRLFPEARIFSFEPLAEPLSVFRKVFHDDPRVTIFAAAIGPNRTSATIHVSKRLDSSSMLPITSMQSSVFPGTEQSRTEVVQVGRLREYLALTDIPSPALLKIDVQGYELEVLKGCNELINGFRYVYVECSFMELYKEQALADEIIDWLHDRSYRLVGIYNLSYDRDGIAIQGDFLFKTIVN